MPSDDSKEFQATQTKHAQDIRTARSVSRITGVPMNQVRQAMRQTSVAQAATQKASEIPRPAPLSQTNPGLFGPGPEVRRLEPKAFIVQPDSGPRRGGMEAFAGGTKELVVDDNSVLNTYIFDATPKA